MKFLQRTMRLNLGVGLLAVSGLLPIVAGADEPRGLDEVALQPGRPTVKYPTLKNKLPTPPAPAIDPTAPGAKIDAMDAPKQYLKPSNVGTIPPFRDSFLGAQPYLGRPDQGGVGYTHYDYQRYRYDIWYRPHAFGYGAAERCTPSPFRPRGYGNLFAEPSTCYRMDYSRYALKNYGTDYGPSYYRRQASETCDSCDHSDWYRPGCDCSRLRPIGDCGPGGTQVWTLGRRHHDD
jgi:hypothetical protein